MSHESGRGLGGLLAAHHTQHSNAIMWPINKIEEKQTDRKTSDLPTFAHSLPFEVGAANYGVGYFRRMIYVV